MDVVFTFSTETLDDAIDRGMFRPPDRLLLGLAHSCRVDSIVVADPYRCGPVRLARTAAGQYRPADTTCVGQVHRHRPLRLRLRDPKSPAAIARSYRRYGVRLKRRAFDLGLTEPTVITTHPLIAGFADLSWASRVGYYARDDWASFAALRPWRAAFEEAYGRIRERAVRVVAVSDPILQRIRPVGPSAVVPNGVDPDEWETLGRPPRWLSTYLRPRLVYTGTVDDRLDFDVIADVALALPQASFLLIGPLGHGVDMTDLGELPSNVSYVGQLGRRELASVLASCDVGLVPHVRSELTTAMSPLKVYEYLAAGLPVVGLDLEPMRGIHRDVLLGDPEDLGRLAHRALGRGRLSDGDRRAFIDENSWEQRHRHIFEILLG